MRDVLSQRYEGENFATEKLLATLHLIMFVLIVGMGLMESSGPTVQTASSVAIEASLR